MTIPPITIPDLDPAGPIDRVNDLVILHQGFNDRKATLEQITAIQLSQYPSIPEPLVGSDVFLVGRYNGSGYTNYLATVPLVTFVRGTQMWFYMNTTPLGWTAIASTGDRLLAVKGGAKYVTGATTTSTDDWQQLDHTLTINEMPEHQHGIRGSHSSTSSGDNNTQLARYAKTSQEGKSIKTTDVGGGLGHNHGADWRPSAAVGVLGRKS